MPLRTVFQWFPSCLCASRRPFFVLVLVFCSTVFAPPSGYPGYKMYPSGLIQLPPNAIIEGSWRQEKLQPDYKISSEDTALKNFLDKARKLKNEYPDELERVEAVLNLVKKTLPQGGYEDAEYRSLMKRYRELDEPVPLGKYITCGAGVCRENALLTNLALQEAGVPALYGYYLVSQGDRVEDHAVNLINVKGNVFVADPYNSNFNGFSLEALLRGKTGRPLPFAEKPENRKIVKLHAYPRYWIPTRRSFLHFEKLDCRAILSNLKEI